MKNLKNVLIKHSESSNPWTIDPLQESEFVLIINAELFLIHPRIKQLVIKAIKTTSFMIKENHLNDEVIVFEFANYILGTLFKEMPDFYLITREQINRKLPNKNKYNIATLKSINEKLFQNHKEEYLFILETDLTDKKII